MTIRYLVTLPAGLATIADELWPAANYDYEVAGADRQTGMYEFADHAEMHRAVAALRTQVTETFDTCTHEYDDEE